MGNPWSLYHHLSALPALLDTGPENLPGDDSIRAPEGLPAFLNPVDLASAAAGGAVGVRAASALAEPFDQIMGNQAGSTRLFRELGDKVSHLSNARLNSIWSQIKPTAHVVTEDLPTTGADQLASVRRQDALAHMRNAAEADNRTLQGMEMAAYTVPGEPDLLMKRSLRVGELGHGRTDAQVARAVAETANGASGIGPETQAALTDDRLYMLQPRLITDTDLDARGDVAGLQRFEQKVDAMTPEVAKRLQETTGQSFFDGHMGNWGMNPWSGQMHMLDSGSQRPSFLTPEALESVRSNLQVKSPGAKRGLWSYLKWLSENRKESE